MDAADPGFRQIQLGADLFQAQILEILGFHDLPVVGRQFGESRG